MQGVETIVLNIDGQEVKVNRLEDGTFEKPDYLKGAEREVIGENFNGRNTISSYKNDGRKSPKALGMNGVTAPATPLAKTWDGWGTALKPAFEPIVVAQKPLDGTYAHNAEKWGVSGLWTEGGRIGTGEDTRRNAKGGENGLNDTSTFKIRERLKNENVQPSGRWPANVIHDGSEEVEAEFAKVGVRTSGDWNGYIKQGASKNGHLKGLKAQPYEWKGDSGSVSRFFYCAKSSSAERGDYNNHPTVKPLELVKYLCRLTRTPTGGLVLDPFAGSGTTALAAIAEGRDYILIEKESDYVEVCKRRIAEYTGQEIAPKEIEISEDKSAKQMPLW